MVGDEIMVDRQIGNFKYSIRPLEDEGMLWYQLVVLSLQDPLFDEWQVEVIDIEDSENRAEIMANIIIKALQEEEMLVEE